MIGILVKSVGQLFEPVFWRVLSKSLFVSLPLLGLSIWFGFWAVGYLPESGWGWIDWLVEKLASGGVFMLAIILFPALSSMVMGLFLDQFADVVEKRNYPDDPPGTPIGLARSMKSALKLGFEIILYNLLALPFYAIFLFFPMVSLALYYGINGYLLNREYFEVVATRHVDEAGYRDLRRRNGLRLFLAGCAIAFVFTVPILNLAAPLLAVGLMVHMLKDLQHV